MDRLAGRTCPTRSSSSGVTSTRVVPLQPEVVGLHDIQAYGEHRLQVLNGGEVQAGRIRPRIDLNDLVHVGGRRPRGRGQAPETHGPAEAPDLQARRVRRAQRTHSRLKLFPKLTGFLHPPHDLGQFGVEHGHYRLEVGLVNRGRHRGNIDGCSRGGTGRRRGGGHLKFRRARLGGPFRRPAASGERRRQYRDPFDCRATSEGLPPRFSRPVLRLRHANGP